MTKQTKAEDINIVCSTITTINIDCPDKKENVFSDSRNRAQVVQGINHLHGIHTRSHAKIPLIDAILHHRETKPPSWYWNVAGMQHSYRSQGFKQLIRFIKN